MLTKPQITFSSIPLEFSIHKLHISYNRKYHGDETASTWITKL